MSEELYTPQEVADLLKIKKNTVYELIKRGELKCRKIGKQFRIRKDELEEYLNSYHSRILAGEDTIKIRTTEESAGKSAEKQGVLKASAPDYNNSKPTSGLNTDIIKPDIIKPETGLDNVYTKEPYGRGIVICGQDILLEILCNYLAGQIPDQPVYRSYLGSYNGLYSLYQGKVDVATAHLWDGETGEYNKEYVKRMLPGVAYQRIHLIKRMQGFYVKEGNPKKIKGFLDLARPEVTMVNREKGSGTRILLDQYLMKTGIKPSGIAGYEKEVTSHLACAGAVARGGADVAIGNERISKELKGIEFIPIQMESYDMVVKEEVIHYDWYKVLLRIINSPEFKEELERLSGYDTTDIGMVMD